MKFQMVWYDVDGNEVVNLAQMDGASLSRIWEDMSPGDTVTVTRTDGVRWK